jgi:hypothetical protein
MTSKALQNKFLKNEKEVLDKFCITKQTANLSGLSNQPSELEQLHIEMAEEAKSQKRKRGDENQIKIKFK